MRGSDRGCGRQRHGLRRRQVGNGLDNGLVSIGGAARQHLQRLQQVGIGAVQETGDKQVQQTPDLFGRLVEVLGLVAPAVAAQVGAVERMFKLTRQLRQLGVAHRARTAGQRMRQRHGRVAHRAVLLQRPFGHFDPQPTRQLVSLVEVDVEQRDADAQPPNLAVALGVSFGLGRRPKYGLRHELRLGQRRQVESQIGRQRARQGVKFDVEVELEVQIKIKIQIQLDGLGHLDQRLSRSGRRGQFIVVQCRQVKLGQCGLGRQRHLGCNVNAGGKRWRGLGRCHQRGQQIEIKVRGQGQVRHVVGQVAAGWRDGPGSAGPLVVQQLGKIGQLGR